MKQAMIFAAGLGTRLKPITEHIPKALVEVGGKPLLEHVLLRMRDAGFEHIVINLHHKADQIVDFLHAKGNFGLDIQLSDERAQLLDTGGGIRHAIPLFDSNLPILIHNVDILSNVDLSNFYEQGTQHDATLLVSQRKTQRYLLFNHDNRLEGWTNIATGEVKTPYRQLSVADSAHYAFAGIHLISPSLLPLLRNEQRTAFGIIDFYLAQCAHFDISAHIEQGLKLLDVGKPETLPQAQAFLQAMQEPADE
ncbi:MAG: sugar phosphate nucleotidyltransferase [Prevotellaceae bacterium]|nr:sugar phosphate nucleotidyltransferase [Prevotellaceae bacterium]